MATAWATRTPRPPSTSAPRATTIAPVSDAARRSPPVERLDVCMSITRDEIPSLSRCCWPESLSHHEARGDDRDVRSAASSLTFRSRMPGRLVDQRETFGRPARCRPGRRTRGGAHQRLMDTSSAGDSTVNRPASTPADVLHRHLGRAILAMERRSACHDLDVDPDRLRTHASARSPVYDEAGEARGERDLCPRKPVRRPGPTMLASATPQEKKRSGNSLATGA